MKQISLQCVISPRSCSELTFTEAFARAHAARLEDCVMTADCRFDFESAVGDAIKSREQARIDLAAAFLKEPTPGEWAKKSRVLGR
jgi:hypothetical protein